MPVATSVSLPASISLAVQGLTAGDPDGTNFGNVSTDLIGFYGSTTPVAQRASAIQAAISNNAASGLLISMNVSTVVPSSGTISASTISPMAVTFASTNLVTSDYLIVNKITAQAGMGIVSARVSTVSTVLIDYINATTANVTATAGELYLVANLRGLASTVTLSPPAIPGNGGMLDSTYTVTGVAPGQLLHLTKPTEQQALGIVGMRVVSNNTIGVTFLNLTNVSVTTPTVSEVYSYVNLSQVNAVNNMLVAQVVTPSLTTVTQGVTTQAITVTGLAATDLVLAVQKPAAQIGLATVGGRVSAANTLEVTFSQLNPSTSNVTPTAGELYTVPFLRVAPANPLLLQQVTLTPTIVGALTTAEVSFAVSNITVSTVVWVNKPSYTSGLGIVGARVVSGNVIGITYVNSTNASITPPAESYLIGNFPTAVGVGHQLIQNVQTGYVANVALTNELRNTLAGLNVFQGS